MRYIDLFAGIGGFRYGLERCNETKTKRVRKKNKEEVRGGKSKSKNERYKRLDSSKTKTQQYPVGSRNRQFTCVYSNEWDKYASQIYKKHYGECDTRDITTVNSSDIPDHDLLCAGFPCQAFSVAGKRLGFEDTRGTLFFEIARIVSNKKPWYLLLENVKGLLSHDKGKTFQTILGVLTDLGYKCEWQVLNSKHFGVPQNRERVFIVGHLGKRSGQKVFPIRESSKGNLEYSGGVISAREKWIKEGKNLSREFSQGQRIYSTKGIAQTLAGNAGGQGGKTGLYDIAPTIRAEHHNTANVHFVPDGMKIRRLTPTECERLQGFPDGWTEGISDTQRYKCLGNAVTTNVVQAIGERLFER